MLYVIVLTGGCEVNALCGGFSHRVSELLARGALLRVGRTAGIQGVRATRYWLSLMRFYFLERKAGNSFLVLEPLSLLLYSLVEFLLHENPTDFIL